jgi:hypothetical protein
VKDNRSPRFNWIVKIADKLQVFNGRVVREKPP